MEFPAKILLFGEYGILLNSMALSIPYSRFSGSFKLQDLSSHSRNEKVSGSNNSLKRLLAYLQSNRSRFAFLHLEQFEEEINNKLYFDSSIPAGYGLGSSGALTAAIYDRYAVNKLPEQYKRIKSELAKIESCFHGASSGIDPLTSLLGKAVLIENDSSLITTPDISKFLNSCSVFLVNSHTNGNTGDMVSWFMNQYRHAAFRKIIHEEYIPIINQTINAAKNHDSGSFSALIELYSQFQLRHFERMIPDSIRKYFAYGIESGYFHLKLCGSGGGGYILTLSNHPEKAEAYFKVNQIEYTLV